MEKSEEGTKDRKNERTEEGRKKRRNERSNEKKTKEGTKERRKEPLPSNTPPPPPYTSIALPYGAMYVTILPHLIYHPRSLPGHSHFE
jgi:hypothetical protein